MSKEPIIGSLDLAPANIGFAWGEGALLPLSLPRNCAEGVTPAPHPKFQSDDISFVRFKNGTDFGLLLWKFEQWLIEWITKNKITKLFVEAPKHKFRDREDARGALQMAGIVDKVCAQLSIDVYEVEVHELKIYVVDRGNCDKGPMMSSARQMGWSFKSSDECDAMWLLAYGREVIREQRYGNLEDNS